MTAHDLYLRAGMIRTVVEDIRDFLDEFAIYTVPADISFPDLVDFLGHAAAANAETDVEATTPWPVIVSWIIMVVFVGLLTFASIMWYVRARDFKAKYVRNTNIGDHYKQK